MKFFKIEYLLNNFILPVGGIIFQFLGNQASTTLSLTVTVSGVELSLNKLGINSGNAFYIMVFQWNPFGKTLVHRKLYKSVH